MSRRGITLVEIIVAMLVASIVLVVAYQAISVMARTQKSADVKASRALLEAQLLETLLQDLRSRVIKDPPDPTPAGVLSGFDRHVVEGGALSVRRVTWSQDGHDHVVREEGGQKRVFDFRGVLDPDVTSVEFRLEACPGEFLSPQPAAGGPE